MNKEDLISLKKKLASLSKEELAKRDLYLSQIEKGEIQGPKTNYASIDKPWNAFFKLNELKNLQVSRTVYQEIYNNNKDHPNDIAINFFGTNITYKKLFENIDKAACALSNVGIKKGDFVTICCAGIPELIYSFYALAKIGAIANLMAPYFDKEQMASRIKDCNSELLLVMDDFYPQVKEAIEASSIKRTVIIPTLNSSILKYIPKKQKLKLNNREIYWNQFIANGKNTKVPETFEYEEKYPLCMVYSSGTTGASKAIVLSHDSFQNSVLSYRANSVDIRRKQKIYQIIPPWYSTGLNSSIHLPLYAGMTVFQDPRFDREIFVKNVIKHQMDYTIAPTSMYEGFLDEKLIKGKKLTKLDYPFEGGEALRNDVREKIEANLKKIGCETTLRVGYGQCECGAQVTTQSQMIKHPEGSVGLPIPGVTVSIFDDDYNELQYNQRGNILVNTPCGMLEYYKNEEATSEYFYIDEAGTKWSCTGDIGYLMENGDLFVEGRASDFTIVNNKKIYNFDIEGIIAKNTLVKNCDVLSTEINGERQLATHIIFDENIPEELINNELWLNDFFKEIQYKIMEAFGDIDMVPCLFKVRKSFPYKPSGKRDIETLLNENTGFCYVNSKDITNKKINLKI